MRRNPTAGGQSGVAMITVLLIVVVLTLTMVAAINYAVQSEPLSRRDQDWNAAMAAAQAGVDDYVYRLQQDHQYYLYSRTNPPTPANPAFTGWQAIPGPANQGQFHYSVDSSQVLSQGMVQLTATGRVRGVQRTIRVNLRRRNFLDYLYLTDFEVLDPLSGYYGSNAGTAADRCDEYWWQARPTSPCVRISFASGDVINGPLHSNDTLSVNGSPRFNGETTTAWTGTMSCPPRSGYNYRWYGLSGCSDTPQFRSGDPQAAPILTLPESNDNIKTETDRSAGKTGCRYSGPTRIVLNAAGTMTVTSPFTPATGLYANCLGSNVALPTNGVIYVQNATSGSCSGGRNPVGYPVNNDVTTYGCRDGDVFLSGTLRGQLTIASENNIVVVDDVQYNTSGAASTDLLGLVANNFVQVYHPVRSNGNDISPTFDNPRIEAAILALNHSFIVQNYSEGSQLGTLTVNGAIAQKWRGPVGTSGGTGYLKNYNYDGRFKTAAPPYSLSPFLTGFKANVWAEIRNPSGLPA